MGTEAQPARSPRLSTANKVRWQPNRSRIYTFLQLLLNCGYFLTQFRSSFRSPAEAGQRLGYGRISRSPGQPAKLSQRQSRRTADAAIVRVPQPVVCEI